MTGMARSGGGGRPGQAPGACPGPAKTIASKPLSAIARAMARIAAGALVVLTASCGGPRAETGFADDAAKYQPIPSGSYLAGLHAGNSRDNEAAAEYFFKALDDDPENPVLLQLTFMVLVIDGRVPEALPLAERLIKKSRGRGVVQLSLALDALRRGDHARVAEVLGLMPQSGVGKLLAPIIRAWSLADQDNYEDAVAVLDQMKEWPEADVMRLFHMALLHEFKRDEDTAAGFYAASLATAGGELLRVVQAYGRLLERSGKAAEAVAMYKKYLDRSPYNPVLEAARRRAEKGGAVPEPLVTSAMEGVAEAMYAAGSALAQERAGRSATIYLQLANFARPGFDVALITLGEQLELLNRWEEAIRSYHKVDRDGPLGWDAGLQAVVGLDRLDKPDEAVEKLRELTRKRPDDPSAFIALADLLRTHERYAEAATEYDHAIRNSAPEAPNRWALHYARGIAYERTKQWPRAEADFLKALELSPDHPQVLNYLGYSWIEQGVNVDRARGMIERAVELRPNDGYVIDSLGWALYKLGNYKEATKHLERAVELRPEDSVINDHLGDAYWHVGRRLEANFQWRHAVSLDPEEDRVERLRKKLENGLEPLTATAEGS